MLGKYFFYGVSFVFQIVYIVYPYFQKTEWKSFFDQVIQQTTEKDP